MDVNIVELKDGDLIRPTEDTPSVVEVPKPKIEATKKKRRRGKSKRKVMKPFSKIPWQDRRKNDKTKRNNRFRKIVMANKTHAPFNNNQFLMEIHKPEPENNFNLARTPSARTRDSSFSVDSEDNYFYSLPEDEEEYLTKEFSSVYEDAQSERLSSMSKDDLIQEYLLLEAKYENLVKRTERKQRYADDEKEDSIADKDNSNRDSMMTDKDTSATSVESSAAEDTSMSDLLQRVKDQDEQIQELQLANEKLKLENERLHQRSQESSSEDSESDSSSTSVSSSSSSSKSVSPVVEAPAPVTNGLPVGDHLDIVQNGETDDVETTYPLVNGFHNPSDQ